MSRASTDHRSPNQLSGSTTCCNGVLQNFWRGGGGVAVNFFSFICFPYSRGGRGVLQKLVKICLFVLKHRYHVLSFPVKTAPPPAQASTSLRHTDYMYIYNCFIVTILFTPCRHPMWFSSYPLHRPHCDCIR